ncbi:MAG: signal peptidase I [Patescibacteria group bacterium]|nr:signal peptidase I [Patescibacteria group bacterium]
MKIVKIINKIFVGIVFAIVLFVVISVIPIPGNYKILIVESGSMEPAIKTGSVVIVKPQKDYQPKDVITFKGAGKDGTITHRIVDIEVITGKTQYITKGDANNAEDSSKTPKTEVIGKVLTSAPYVGYLLAEAKKPIGFTILVILPCLIIIFGEIRKIIIELRRKGQQVPPL